MTTTGGLAHIHLKCIFCKQNSGFVSHSFFLDEEALESIMSTKEVKDKPVCIVSVAGEGRI